MNIPNTKPNTNSLGSLGESTNDYNNNIKDWKIFKYSTNGVFMLSNSDASSQVQALVWQEQVTDLFLGQTDNYVSVPNTNAVRIFVERAADQCSIREQTETSGSHRLFQLKREIMKRKAELFAGRRKAPFTIVELIVAMSIFAILMLILMQIFSATQDVWRRTAQKSDAAEMARTALDLLTTDLQSAIYINDFDGPSFYYDQTADMIGRTLWFATTKSSLTESNQLSKNVEVEYVLTKMEDSPKDGVDLYQLEYYITSDDFKDYNSKNSEWDFETIKRIPMRTIPPGSRRES